MPAKLKIEGQRFSNCLVLSSAGTKKGKSIWKVLCDCGTVFVAVGGNLRSGMTKSCGCIGVEAIRTRSTKHGHTIGRKTSREYNSWLSMKQRCCDPNHEYYFNFGGKGIKVEERWLNFESFFADMGKCPEKHNLHRKDNTKDFCRENCVWFPVTKQSNEKTQNTSRKRRLWDLFRLTPEDFEIIKTYQQNHPTFKLLLGKAKKRDAVEHRHKDGLIRGLMAVLLNRAYGVIERLYPNNTSTVLRALADFHDNPPASLALNGPRYGLLGRAEYKKKKIYGSPTGPIKPTKKVSKE